MPDEEFDFADFVRNIEIYRSAEPYRTRTIKLLEYLGLPHNEAVKLVDNETDSNLKDAVAHALVLRSYK